MKNFLNDFIGSGLMNFIVAGYCLGVGLYRLEDGRVGIAVLLILIGGLNLMVGLILRKFSGVYR